MLKKTTKIIKWKNIINKKILKIFNLEISKSNKIFAFHRVNNSMK